MYLFRQQDTTLAFRSHELPVVCLTDEAYPDFSG